jgi:hypothetical protein
MIGGMRRVVLPCAAVLALALPSAAAAERLPIFEITASGSVEQTWDMPRHPIDDLPPTCSGQELREGNGGELLTWKMRRMRVKVERWRDGSPGFLETAKATGSVTRDATVLRIHEPGECDPERRIEDEAYGCGTRGTRFSFEIGMREHRLYVARLGGSERFGGCPLWEHGGGRNDATVTERRLRRQRTIVLRNEETIRRRQLDSRDANTVKRIRWTVTLKRVGWRRWPG